MKRAAHTPDLHQDAVLPQGALNLGDGNSVAPCSQCQLRGGHDLGLYATRAAYDVKQVFRSVGLPEEVALESIGMYLRPRKVTHLPLPVSRRANVFKGCFNKSYVPPLSARSFSFIPI